MLVGKTPPEDGRGAHWHTQKRLAGKNITAHVAGPGVLVEVHTGKPTLPCLRCYLGETAKCNGCTNRMRRDTVCYLPVYAYQDGKGRACVFHRDMFERIEALRHGDHVHIGWPEQENCGAWIRKEKGPIFVTTNPQRKTDSDLTLWLPTLWKLVGILTPQMLRGDGEVKVTTHCHTPTESEELARIEREAPEQLKKLRDAHRGWRDSKTEAVGMGEVIDGKLNGIPVNGKPHKPKE